MKLRLVVQERIWRIFKKGPLGKFFLWLLLRLADSWGVKRDITRTCTFPFVIHRRNRSFQILYYHRVNDDRHPFFCGTFVKTFSGQMEQLRKYFTVLPLEELVMRRHRRDVPDRAVAISFDDGYKDNFSNAFPILRDLGLPATIFLTTGIIESEKWFWHDQVFEAFHYTHVQVLAIEGTSYALSTKRQKSVALSATLKRLRQLHPKDRDVEILNLIEQLDPQHQIGSEQDKLTWDDVKIMAKNQITFGAHTVSHPILSRLSLEEAYREIMDSKSTIEKHLNAPVRLFAYPNGSRDDFNDSIKDYLRSREFQCAVTTIWGTNDQETDLFELRRVNLENMDPSVVASRLGYYKFAS